MEKYYDYSDHIEKAMSSFSNEKTNFVFKINSDAAFFPHNRVPPFVLL